MRTFNDLKVGDKVFIFINIKGTTKAEVSKIIAILFDGNSNQAVYLRDKEGFTITVVIPKYILDTPVYYIVNNTENNRKYVSDPEWYIQSEYKMLYEYSGNPYDDTFYEHYEYIKELEKLLENEDIQ